MRTSIRNIGILMLMLFANVVWSSPGFESANPDAVLHFIQGNNAFVYLSAFFGLGVLLAFTPCVLPMVPILSGIIVGQKSLSTLKAFRLSLSYVIGMAITYAGAGMLAGLMGSTIQTMMQRPVVIVLFSMIFIIMALSMFGLFELRLPPSLTDKLCGAGHSNTKRNYISVALMGVLSTLVVSPCVTAPLIGVLSYIGQKGQVLMGGLILFVMALGMGIPLLIVGSGYGSLLPKTGSWMIKIKYFFGLMMLGISIWMFSRILDASLIKILWAALLIIGSISLGSLQSQKSKKGLLFQTIGVMAIIYGSIILYGLGVSIFNPSLESRVVENQFIKVSKLSDVNHQLALAKKNHKVAFVEFSANWCGDCQDMDSKVFNQPKITQAMSGLVNIKVDISDKSREVDEIKKAFAIYGTPTMLFFDARGTQITKLAAAGFVSELSMLDLLNKAHQSS
ncbi:protein-disulfide reductase DsbD [Legionella maioricensis]|uniref:Protein-disulfide reductase DsbD n=1 Tax=Legionella maioricensis TaxID=2896528 RepID=A0A9X2CZE8_9GAMM|nr:protein-disulfide reductase DsbD [Legionella maioricensis]MCL9683740.1 protein-disulfide reductase DsbD [Legionella maioricensis]MCL9687514.1 protein-disulfide reductase DsbD [Legionella maioricensis]